MRMLCSSENRVVALLDMDCFYVQVEQREKPELWGKPVAVVQYNQWKGGGLIAVGYEAREKGVKRGSMRGEEAKRLCPHLTLCSVPVNRDKADLTKYRNASAEVFQVLNNLNPLITVERASIDEAYLDLTSLISDKHKDLNYTIQSNSLKSTFIISDSGTSVKEWLQDVERDTSDWRLAAAAIVVEEIRAQVLEHTKFYCSAGIANGKTLAKLVCAKNKPRKQTIIPMSEYDSFFKQVKIDSVRNLGGKLGQQLINECKINTLGELREWSLNALKKEFSDKHSQWLYEISHGKDNEPVTARELCLTIACSKNFTGPAALDTKAKIKHWLSYLVEELNERLVKDQINNKRVARKLVVGLRNTPGPTLDKPASGFGKANTRHATLTSYKIERIADVAYSLFTEFNTATGDEKWFPAVVNLSVGAGKFEDAVDCESHAITKYFTPTLKPSKLANSAGIYEANRGQTINQDVATCSKYCGDEADKSAPKADNSTKITLADNSTKIALKADNSTENAGMRILKTRIPNLDGFIPVPPRKKKRDTESTTNFFTETLRQSPEKEKFMAPESAEVLTKEKHRSESQSPDLFSSNETDKGDISQDKGDISQDKGDISQDKGDISQDKVDEHLQNEDKSISPTFGDYCNTENGSRDEFFEDSGEYNQLILEDIHNSDGSLGPDSGIPSGVHSGESCKQGTVIISPHENGVQESTVELIDVHVEQSDIAPQFAKLPTNGAVKRKSRPAFNPDKYYPKQLKQVDQATLKALPPELRLELEGMFKPVHKNIAAATLTESERPNRAQKTSPGKKKSGGPPKNNRRIVDFFAKK